MNYNLTYFSDFFSDDPDAASHEIYIANNSKQFFGGESYFSTLDDHIRSHSEHAMMVTGMSGCGKTWSVV